MNRLLRRAALFALPFVLLTVFVALVDPYNCLGFSHLVGDSAKWAAARPLHNPLWKLEQFKRDPVSRIILGDSSMGSINADEVKSVTGENYYNFAYGGGTLAEALDTYWIAADRIHLDAVYIGIGLINFNEYQNLNRVPEAQAMMAKPLLYLTNRIVIGAAFLAAYTSLTGNPVNIGVPASSRESFWREQIDESLPQLLHQYKYPATLAAALQNIAADCRARGTRLVIVIPPTEIELQDKVVALGRGDDDARFRSFVAGIATVYDLDYPNAFTEQRSNFLDPFHATTDAMVIAEVWGNRGLYSRRTNPP